MNELTFHKATVADIETLVEKRLMFALELSGDQRQEDIVLLREQLTSYFLKATAENTCISYFGKYGDVVAGIGSVHIRETPGNFRNLSGKWGYIMNMYTIPEFRRMGISTRILNLLTREANELGVTAFELHATKEGEYVYKKNGFEVHIEPTYKKYHSNKL